MALGIQCGMREKSENVQTIVQSDNDRAAVHCQLPAIVIVAFAVKVTATVDPDHDRALASSFMMAVAIGLAKCWCEYVQIQAVFMIAPGRERSEGVGLHTGIPVRQCVKHSVPAGDRLRRPPAKLPYRGRGIRNAQEDAYAILDKSANWTFVGLNYGSAILISKIRGCSRHSSRESPGRKQHAQQQSSAHGSSRCARTKDFVSLLHHLSPSPISTPS